MDEGRYVVLAGEGAATCLVGRAHDLGAASKLILAALATENYACQHDIGPPSEIVEGPLLALPKELVPAK